MTQLGEQKTPHKKQHEARKGNTITGVDGGFVGGGAH